MILTRRGGTCTLVSLAVRATFVAFNFDERFQGQLVLCCAICSRVWRSSRHDVDGMRVLENGRDGSYGLFG